MKSKSREDYSRRMQRRGKKPPLRKVRRPKDHEAVSRESNTALVAKNQNLANKAAHDIILLLYERRVLIDALDLVCKENWQTPEYYIERAERAIKESEEK